MPGVEQLILFGSRARGAGSSRQRLRRGRAGADLSERARVRRTLSDLAYGYILNGFYIRPLVLPSGYLHADGHQPTELAEAILRDGAEIV